MKIVISFGVKEQPKYGKILSDKLEAAFGYPILTEESTVVKIILKSDMNPVLLNGIVGTRLYKFTVSK